MRSRLVYTKGYSLLEAIVASAIFVMVAVAFSSVWAMYAKSAGKSQEYVVANHLARSYIEGLAANGYNWLELQVKSGPHGGDNPPTFTDEKDVTITRRVRSRSADISYHVKYELTLNTDPDTTNEYTNDRPIPYAPEAVCRIRTSVAWNSTTGNSAPSDMAGYNSGVSYLTLVYRNGMN